MQQATPVVPVMPSFTPSNITTDQIQKLLDENKKLILAIMENQNHGKLAECAQCQALLQKNLMYLAAIADAQPQTPPIPSQIAPHPVMQQSGFYMQHPQTPPLFPQKSPPPPQFSHHQQQAAAAIQGQMNLRLGGFHNSMHPHSSSPASLPPLVGPSDVRGGTKKDVPEAGGSGTDHGGSNVAK